MHAHVHACASMTSGASAHVHGCPQEAFADLIGAYETCVLERQPRPSNTRDLHVVTGGEL